MYDYSSFIDRINVNQKIHKMNINQSVDEAVDWACEQNLHEGYIKEQKAEVKAMLLTEYDEEAHKRAWRNEGRLQMAEESAVNLLRMKLGTPEQIAKAEGLSLEKVLELQMSIKAKP